MTIEKVKKIGFIAALAMLLGSVVGVGIFFKNGGISRAVDGNGLTWLLAWIIGGLVALSAAICFSESGRFKARITTSLAGWIEKCTNSKVGYFFRFNYAFIYWGLLAPVLGFFGSETVIAFIYVIKYDNVKDAFTNMNLDIPVYVHVIIGIMFTVFFTSLNYLSMRWSGVLQVVTTFLKFIPLIVAIIVGIIFANVHNVTEGKNIGKSAFGQNSFTFSGLIVALPAVLFAYDGYLSVAQITSKVKGGEKRTAWIVFIGILSVAILYTLIALSSILHNQGSIGSLIQDSLPKNTALYVNIIVYGFLMASTFGVINGMTAGFVVITDQCIQSDTYFGSKTLKAKWGKEKTNIFFLTTITLFWIIIFGSISAITDTDVYIDGFSGMPVTFFAPVYALSIFLYSLKRKTFTHNKLNNKLYFLSAFVAISILSIASIYLIGYEFIYKGIHEPFTTNYWGLFANKTPGYHISESMIFLGILILFITLPFINSLLCKKFENFEPNLINTVDFDDIDLIENKLTSDAQ